MQFDAGSNQWEQETDHEGDEQDWSRSSSSSGYLADEESPYFGEFSS